jgi:predicted RecB family nuclease
LADLQGRVPETIHVVIDDQTKISLWLADFVAYYRAAKERFVAACAVGVTSYPLPVDHCHVCLWRSQCGERRIEDDHLTLVPGLRTDQARTLATEAGITTIEQLASSREDGLTGIGWQVFEKVRAQARLQVAAREHPELPPPYELFEGGAAGIGLAALPMPSSGDLFFDIDGDPFVGESGLEYLLGAGWIEPGGEFGFWAHDGNEEKESFEAFMDFVGERQAAHPDLHIYHYASLSTTSSTAL